MTYSRCEACIKLINHKCNKLRINQTDWTPIRDGWYRDCFYSWLDNSVSCWLYDVIMCFLTLAGQFPSAYATWVFVHWQNKASCLANKHNVYSNQPELWAHICNLLLTQRPKKASRLYARPHSVCKAKIATRMQNERVFPNKVARRPPNLDWWFLLET